MLVALKVGLNPASRWLFLFLSVIVTVEVETPSATMFDVPVIDEFAAAAKVSTKTAFPVSVLKPVGLLTETVFISSKVDFKVPVDCPFKSDTLAAEIVFEVPVAAKVGVTPEIRLS